MFDLWTSCCCRAERNSMGHFRVAPSLCIKSRLSARLLISKQLFISLRSRCLEKKRAGEKETREGRGSACTEGPRKSFPAPSPITWQPLRDLWKVLTRVSPSRWLVLSFAHYFQAPVTQANFSFSCTQNSFSHEKGFALRLLFKVRVFGTWKWPF